MKNAILQTERLYLRKLTLDDAQALLPILGDEEVMRFSISGPMDLDEIKVALKDGFMKSYETYGFGRYAVIRKSDEAFLGFCGPSMQKLDGQGALVEIGYRFAPGYWGKGYASEAALAVKEYLFNDLNIPECISIIEPANTRSIRVAEKLGMTVLKQAKYYGKIVNVYHIKR